MKVRYGVSNIGWVPGPECDTGWRDIGASLLNGWAAIGAGVARIRRHGSAVTLRMGYRIDSANATTDQFLDVGSEWWAPDPTVNYYIVGSLYTGQVPTATPTTHAVWTNVGDNSAYGGYGLECKARDIRTTGEVLWQTNSTLWVTSLLGTAI